MLRRQNVQIQRQIRAATSRKLDFCQISFRIFKIRLLNLKEENGLTSDKGEIKIKSLQKALTILDCFAEKQPLGVTEISEKLGLYKSNTYDILTTLNAMGYLEKARNQANTTSGKSLSDSDAWRRIDIASVTLPHLICIWWQTRSEKSHILRFLSDISFIILTRQCLSEHGLMFPMPCATAMTISTAQAPERQCFHVCRKSL